MPSPKVESSHKLAVTVTCGSYSVKSNDVLKEITIENYINRIATCEVILLAKDPAKDKAFELMEKKDLEPGGTIEVKAGYGTEEELIFKGIITKLGAGVEDKSGTTIKLEAKDASVKMTVGRQNRFFEKKTDKDIITEVIGKHSGVTGKVGDIKGKLPMVVQYNATDWDFALARADRNGMIVTTGENTLTVSDPGEAKKSTLEVSFGEDILSFEADVESISQYKKVSAYAWSPKDQKLVEGSDTLADAGYGNLKSTDLAKVSGLASYNLQSTIPMEKAELDSWAKALTAKVKYAKARGNMSFQGSSLAKPATTIKIARMGKRFNGDALISGVKHELKEGNWTTTVQLGLDSERFTEKVKVEPPEASGLLPGIQGLQVGKVTKIDEDPDNEFRVQVKLPLAQPNGKEVWARLLNFTASAEFGAFFYPQVDDEVILGFLNNDPRFPVILGSVYSSKNKAPYKPDDKNTTQAIVTKNKVTIELNDDKKIMTLSTPSGHTVVMDDDAKKISIITAKENQLVLDDDGKKVTMKDANDNSIEMSSSGIVIKSGKGITLDAGKALEAKAGSSMTLKASQGLEAKAGTSFDLKGGSALNVKGPNISIKADAQAELKGGAAASVDGGGMCKIKGGMVMIN